LTRRKIPKGVKLRVLVVDDSVVIRQLVTHALGEDPHIEVVGSAANGLIALQKIPQLNPDAVTLDIEMPELDGLATLREIRKRYPDLCVIMFSTLTDHGASATFEALALGANDYVTKASNAGSLDRSLSNLRSELVPKIEQFFLLEDKNEAPPPPFPMARPDFGVKRPAIRKGKREVVVIGVSTGGPAALAEIVPMFPAAFPLPILIVQHMPPMFTRLLAERLQAKTSLEVSEAGEGMRVARGSILIAPGDHHLTVHNQGSGVVVKLNQQPPENSCRPAADVLFRSAGEVYGGGCIGVVLTGMGRDGYRGAEELKARGAYVVAQDEASSVVWGMPGFVARAGLADAVLPLTAVVPEILRQAGGGR
jgi:two-component system chemotaxis response regulator CheB